MLHDVPVRAVPEQPAGEGPVPFLVTGFLHVQLDEGACFLRIFPRSGLLAGAQPHNGRTDAQRLPGLQGEIFRQTVALIEKPDDGNALCHRRAQQRPARVDGLARLDHRRFGLAGRIVALAGLTTTGAKGCGHQYGDARSGHFAPNHWASGVHAS
jgi:hypothetical protein